MMTQRNSVGHAARVPYSDTRAACPTSRRATVLVAVVASLFIVMLIAMALLRGLVMQQRQMRAAERELQALWLTESAISRASARLRHNQEYVGETWHIDGKQLAGQRGGEVHIRVAASENNPDAHAIYVETNFPNHPMHRVQHIGQAVINR